MEINNLAARRHSHGLSLRAVAALSGVSYATVRRYEQGLTDMSVSKLNAINAAYDQLEAHKNVR
jgi:transcriptional regulator with XRE-family HTH domain